MPRHELAMASNISNTIHCMHKSNVNLHELDIYSMVVIYFPTFLCKSFHILTSWLASYIATHVLYSLISTKHSDMLNKNTHGAKKARTIRSSCYLTMGT